MSEIRLRPSNAERSFSLPKIKHVHEIQTRFAALQCDTTQVLALVYRSSALQASIQRLRNMYIPTSHNQHNTHTHLINQTIPSTSYLLSILAFANNIETLHLLTPAQSQVIFYYHNDSGNRDRIF